MELELSRKPVPRRALAPEGTVRLPRSASRRHAVAWLKLLASVNARAPGGFAFEGRILRPGGELAIAEIPEPAVLLECAGNEGGLGHNRGECLYILWQYWPGAPIMPGLSADKAELSSANGQGEWHEAARAQSVDAEWARDLAPIAARLLTARKAMGVALSAAAVAERALEVLEAGLAELSREDRVQALGIVHDRLAARVANG